MSAKGKWWRWLLPILAALLVYGLARCDAFMYPETVAQVTAIKTGKTTPQKDNFGNKDTLTTQHVTARLLNTSKKGQSITLTNQYSQSGAMDAPLAVGDQFFATASHGRWSLHNFKRDAVTLALLAMTIVLLALIMRRRFWLTAISIMLNALVFWAALHIEIASHQELAFVLFSLLAIVFTAITTLFVVGIKPLALVVGAATVGATGLAVALGYLIFTLTAYNGVHIETVNYVTQAPQLLFFVQIIIGSLGAVLDECSDIAVSLFQMHSGAKARFKAGMAIGRNVMGPLITVLFMIFIADTFSEAVLWLRNDNAISQTVSWVMGLGFAQSLISAFGIVLAIPLTSALAAFLGTRGQRRALGKEVQR